MEDENKIPEDLIVIDTASIPQGWDVAKMLHIMKTQGILIVDSFREGNQPKPVMPYVLNSRRKMNYKIVEHEDYLKSKNGGK